MRNKILILATLVAICTLSLASFGNSSNFVSEIISSVGTSSLVEKIFKSEVKVPKPSEPVTTQSQSNVSAQNVPDRIIYLILFNHLVGLKNHAAQTRLEGSPSFDYTAIAKKEMALNDAQSTYLFQIAEDCLSEIKPIDDQAQTIIRDAQDELVDGLNTPRGRHEPPPPPAALLALQRDKDGIVLHYQKVLSDYLGEEQFTQFNQSVNQMIAPQVTILNNSNMTNDRGAK